MDKFSFVFMAPWLCKCLFNKLKIRSSSLEYVHAILFFCLSGSKFQDLSILFGKSPYTDMRLQVLSLFYNASYFSISHIHMDVSESTHIYIYLDLLTSI